MNARPLSLLLAALLAACSSDVSPAPSAPPTAEAPAKEHGWWDSYGMPREFYEAAGKALSADSPDELAQLCAQAGRQPDNGLLKLCCANSAPRCLQWVLAQGVPVHTSDEYWGDVCPSFCCEVDEEEADKLRHILFPLLRANPALLQPELISPIVIYLAEHGCRRTMKRLLELGAPAEVADPRGRTALDYARFYGYREVEKLLRAHGAARVTLDISRQQYEQELERQQAARQRQLVEEYEAKLRTLKPGEPWPTYPVVGWETLHRPALP